MHLWCWMNHLIKLLFCKNSFCCDFKSLTLFHSYCSDSKSLCKRKTCLLSLLSLLLFTHYLIWIDSDQMESIMWICLLCLLYSRRTDMCSELQCKDWASLNPEVKKFLTHRNKQTAWWAILWRLTVCPGVHLTHSDNTPACAAQSKQSPPDPQKVKCWLWQRPDRFSLSFNSSLSCLPRFIWFWNVTFIIHWPVASEWEHCN